MTDWMADAACKGKPTFWWIPNSKQVSKYAPLAKQICDACPVAEQCRAHADKLEATGERIYGRWGGETANERWARPRACSFNTLHSCVNCKKQFEAHPSTPSSFSHA